MGDEEQQTWDSELFEDAGIDNFWQHADRTLRYYSDMIECGQLVRAPAQVGIEDETIGRYQ